MTSDLPVIDYARHPAYGGMFEPDPALGEEAVKSLEPLIEQMVKVEEERLDKFGYRYGARGRVGKDLLARGISHLQLPDALIDPICKAAKPVIADIQQRIAETRAENRPIKFKTVEQVLAMDTHGSLWKATDRFLREMEIYETVAAFFDAKSARINSLAVFCNPPGQDWASNLFKDRRFETPPTAGFHIDSNGKCYLKGILYLDDVGPDQGPFGLVAESHLWAQGSLDRIYRRAFDRSRMLARAADERHKFVSLPKRMQVKAEFGGDMLAGSPEAEDLLARELVSIGPKGFLSLFYPEAIHRGGNVRSGERHALQITLTAQW